LYFVHEINERTGPDAQFQQRGDTRGRGDHRTKHEPVSYEEPAEGPALTRIHVEERFTGDIDGDAVAEFLQIARADGSAGFLDVGRVTGRVAGPVELVRVAGRGHRGRQCGQW
jgi:hypothetical protein